MNSEQHGSSFAPSYAIPPGATLHEMLEHLGLSQAELAERTGRPKKTINEIVKGKAAITPDTALQFERVLGPPASFWNSLEQNYRSSKARIDERARLASDVSWIDKFPTKELTAADPNKACAEAKVLCASAGVAFVLVPELPKLRICGATRWLSAERALVQLSLFYKRDDHFWFSFFHEAGHILLHGKKEIFVEQERGSKEREEQEANAFAANYLIPATEYDEFVSCSDFSTSAIKRFASAVAVSASIVVGRLQHDKCIGFHEHNELHTRLDWA